MTVNEPCRSCGSSVCDPLELNVSTRLFLSILPYHLIEPLRVVATSPPPFHHSREAKREILRHWESASVSRIVHLFNNRRSLSVILIVVAAWCVMVGSADAFGQAADEPGDPATYLSALETYIAQPDPSSKCELLKTTKSPKATIHLLKLTSQTWRNADEVDRPLWEHWVTIVQPTGTQVDTGFLMVTGGSNKGGPPDKPDGRILAIAEATRSVVVELKMVPNQPLVFFNDGVERYEDDLIGYCWNKFIETGDPLWLPRLPMVKSVIKTMDCAQELLASEAGGGFKLTNFVVGGASKRGWTTWMSGASRDPRIVALVPIVIDVVNVDATMRNHVEVYGFWSEAVNDYVVHKIMARWDHPRLKNLYQAVDPYYHLDKLTMPKYVLNGAGDQFFTPDSANFYFKDLKGPKLLRYVPNADHSLRDSDALDGIIAFHWAIVMGKPLPALSWDFTEDGSIVATSDVKPSSATLWKATNSKARDFRLETIGKAWESSPVEANDQGQYVARVEPPSAGWTAFFIEFRYDLGGPAPLIASTAVRVTPDKKPYAGIIPNTAPAEAQLKAGN